MIGEKIVLILKPKSEKEWILIQTDKNLYSFRLGGIKKEVSSNDIEKHDEIPFSFENKEIRKIYSDGEWVYVFLEGDGVIVSGWTSIISSGEMFLGVSFSTINEFDSDFFANDDLLELAINSKGDYMY